MAKERNTEFKYEIVDGFDHIIQESGNSSINLRKISWNDRPFKIDLRKYSYKDGQEQMMKGVSISEDGANELTGVLVEAGYGDTKRIASALRKRDNFKEGMLDEDYVEEDDGSEEFYDPKQLLNLSTDDDEDDENDDE